MSDQTSVVASRYAKALFELAKEKKKLDAVEKDLTAFNDLVSESAPLRAAVSNPTISRAGLEQMLKAGLSKEKLDKITNNFIQLLAKNRRVDLIGKVTASFNAYLDEHRNVAVAEVTVAKKMSAAQEKALAKELKAATGKDVRLQVRVDEGILGGMIVKVGSLMLDGSLSGRLEGLKRVSKQAVTTL